MLESPFISSYLGLDVESKVTIWKPLESEKSCMIILK